jgi:hypothetical protein
MGCSSDDADEFDNAPDVVRGRLLISRDVQEHPLTEFES